LSSGNKNPETKIKILFWKKNPELKNNTFQKKKIWKRNYCVSEMKIQKQK